MQELLQEPCYTYFCCATFGKFVAESKSVARGGVARENRACNLQQFCSRDKLHKKLLRVTAAQVKCRRKL